MSLTRIAKGRFQANNRYLVTELCPIALQSLKLNKFGHGLLCCVMQSIRCLKCVMNRYFHDNFWGCLHNSAFTLFIAIIFSFSIKIVILLSLLFSIACFMLYNGHDFFTKQNRVCHIA